MKSRAISLLVIAWLVLESGAGAVWASPPDNASATIDSVLLPSPSTPLHNSIPTTAEKRVTFYHSYGFEIGQNWHIPITLWVSERPDSLRRLTAKSAQKVLIKKANMQVLSDRQALRYKEVVDGFIADSESNENVSITFANDPQKQQYPLIDVNQNSKTDRNGNLVALLVISRDRVDQLLRAQQSQHGWLEFHAVSAKHVGAGFTRMIKPVGLSVISDIDDTIKDTGIIEGDDVVLRNTFFKPFEKVKCMPQLYQQLDASVSIHYVSGAPWQLYVPLVDFMFSDKVAYPMGSLHMKSVRTNLTTTAAYSDIWKLVSGGSKQVTFEQKLAQITQLINHFPARQFILIGDSGERDPEVFAEIRNRFPAHIEKIIIRDLGNTDDNRAQRYAGMALIPGNANEETGCGNINALLP